jgi:transposase
MIVIGADTHKRTHALAAVDANTGQLLDEREIPARDVGYLEALRWAHELDREIVWAIEDCRDLSYHLEQALLAAGERVVRVALKLMGVSRRGEREPGKSDQIDARAIGRAVLRGGIERFPVAFLDEDAMEIRLLCDHREALINERTHGSSTGCGSTSSFSTRSLRHRSRRASSTTPGSCSASYAA